jgi:hypothetical protein
MTPCIRLYGLVALAVVSLSFAAGSDDWRPLFNGKDLSGWESYLGRPPASVDLPGVERNEKGQYTKPLGINHDPLHVFTVIELDGRPALRISGQVPGGLATVEKFGNYRLRLQYKWGEKIWNARPGSLRNGGVNYHGYGGRGSGSTNWVSGHQLEMKENDCGDYYAMGGGVATIAVKDDASGKLKIYDPRGVPTDFADHTGSPRHCVKTEPAEKPTGEWNTLELVCYGEQSAHLVNGKLVLRVAKSQRTDGGKLVPLTSGVIELQSENAELFVRDIAIQPLSAPPAELASPGKN